MTTALSLACICLLLVIAYAASAHRHAENLRTVGGALGLQGAVAGIVLYVPAGRAGLEWLSDRVSGVLDYAQSGIEFLFGDIGRFETGFVFAFHVLPVIIFFSSLVAVLYYIGIMGWLIRVIGGGLRWLLGTGRAESLSATANIFVSQTEAPLVIKPYLPSMTRSELFAVMVGGMATVAGSVLAGYVALGVEALSLELLLGTLFRPLAFMLGVPWEEAAVAGNLIGQKLVLNEFVAFTAFYEDRTQLSEHSQAVVSFALCGFANFSSIAILLGGLGTLAPSRRSDVAELGLRAVFAGFMANLMSAAIAGLFLSLA